MKTLQLTALLLSLLIGLNLQAQIVNPYSKARQVENEIKRQKKKEKEEKEKQEKQENQESPGEQTSAEKQTDPVDEKPQLVWSKYDFIPGDVVPGGWFKRAMELLSGKMSVATSRSL